MVKKLESGFASVLVDNTSINEDEWRAYRTLGIGGSDAGAIMGMNQYSSAFMVALEKLGMAPQKKETDAMRHGKRMEPILREEIVKILADEGIKCQAFESPFMYQSKEHPFMLANIDGLIEFAELATLDGINLEGTVLLECKAVSDDRAWRNNELPDSYYCQVQHYMAVLGLECAILAVLIKNRIEYRVIPRNEQFIAKLIEKEDYFWHTYVEKKALPDPIGIDGESEYIDALYPAQNANPDIAPLPAEMEQLGNRYLDINEQLKELEDEKQKIKNQFKVAIGLSQAGCAGNIQATISRYAKKQFQKEKFEKDYPGIYDQYVEPVMQESIRIRRIM
jgi:putative phage-type endonuclease